MADQIAERITELADDENRAGNTDRAFRRAQLVENQVRFTGEKRAGEGRNQLRPLTRRPMVAQMLLTPAMTGLTP